MPWKSQAQRRWMYANHPEMARRWAEHTKDPEKLPERVKESAKKPSLAQAHAKARDLAETDSTLGMLADYSLFPGGTRRAGRVANLAESYDVPVSHATTAPFTTGALVGIPAGLLGAWLGSKAAPKGYDLAGALGGAALGVTASDALVNGPYRRTDRLNVQRGIVQAEREGRLPRAALPMVPLPFVGLLDAGAHSAGESDAFGAVHLGDDKPGFGAHAFDFTASRLIPAAATGAGLAAESYGYRAPYGALTAALLGRGAAAAVHASRAEDMAQRYVEGQNQLNQSLYHALVSGGALRPGR